MRKSLPHLAAIILAISPLFDPYILFSINTVEVGVIDVLIVFAAGLILYTKREAKLDKILLIMLTVFFVINILSFLVFTDNRNFLLSLRVLILWTIYAILTSILWQSCHKDMFVKTALCVGIFAAGFIFVQILALSFNFEQVWDGRIPFLKLSEYDDWAKLRDITGVIRPHSIFQEPSYFTIYLLPLIAYTLEQKKIMLFLFFVVAAVFSTSSIALALIFAIVFIFALQFDIRSFLVNHKTKVLILMGAAIISFVLLYVAIPPFHEMVDYSFLKIAKIGKDLQSNRMGSAKLRLIGNVGIFSEFTPWQKLFGMGANQYTLVFPKLIPYSNSFVTTFLNFGIFGMGTILYFFSKLLDHMSKETRIFALLFILLCFVDLFWFNWFFFYVLTWAILFSRNDEKIRIDLQVVMIWFDKRFPIPVKRGKRYDAK